MTSPLGKCRRDRLRRKLLTVVNGVQAVARDAALGRPGGREGELNAAAVDLAEYLSYVLHGRQVDAGAAGGPGADPGPPDAADATSGGKDGPQ
jgi:hypothetical protein